MAVAAGVCAVSLILVGDPESHPLAALVQYVPYLAYLLPTILALVWSCWLGWAWRLVSAISVGLVLTLIMGLVWGHPDEGHGHLRVMTYNSKAHLAMAAPNGGAALALEIYQHDPDVLVMQDAGELMQWQRERPDMFNAIVGKRDVYSFGQYIIASRLPLKACAPGSIPIRKKPHSFVHCVLTVHGEEIDLVTVHFLTPREGLNATRHGGLKGLAAWRVNMEDRLTQSHELAAQLNAMKRKRIVMGDLNAPESSTVVQTLLRTGMRDAFSSAGRGYGYTHGHSLRPGLSFLRIDHILVSDDIGVSQAFAGGSAASEHRPVIADLQVTR
ncbi:MAG: endonuclease/exonuclease/phosphatase family protein [Aquabacterium sp.]|nr:endonuclease/exonuclease/phosphatase family protein [Aquabacterium sp.]